MRCINRHQSKLSLMNYACADSPHSGAVVPCAAISAQASHLTQVSKCMNSSTVSRICVQQAGLDAVKRAVRDLNALMPAYRVQVCTIKQAASPDNLAKDHRMRNHGYATTVLFHLLETIL